MKSKAVRKIESVQSVVMMILGAFSGISTACLIDSDGGLESVMYAGFLIFGVINFYIEYKFEPISAFVCKRFSPSEYEEYLGYVTKRESIEPLKADRLNRYNTWLTLFLGGVGSAVALAIFKTHCIDDCYLTKESLTISLLLCVFTTMMIATYYSFKYRILISYESAYYNEFDDDCKASLNRAINIYYFGTVILSMVFAYMGFILAQDYIGFFMDHDNLAQVERAYALYIILILAVFYSEGPLLYRHVKPFRKELDKDEDED